jgi:probable HAF family extracellular repeat protein
MKSFGLYLPFILAAAFTPWAAGAASLTPLGDLAGGDFNSLALGVSGDGSVVAGQGNSASGQEAFRWTSGGGMVGLGDLPGGSFISTARGVSSDGSVVVGYGYSAGGQEAFRWTSGGGMVGLGDLPGGAFWSEAYGVSGDGSVVVGYGYSASGQEASVWTSGGGMQSLVSLLLAQAVDPAAGGWTRLWDARGISADGRYVVGYGTRNGNTEAFLADLGGAEVPEASTWAAVGTLALATGGTLWRRRR